MSTSEFDEENFDAENKRISEFLDYLLQLTNPLEQLIDDPKAFDVISYLHRITSIAEFSELIDWKLFLDKQCYTLFGQFVSDLLGKLKTCTDGNPKQTFAHLIKLLNAIFSKSALFCVHFNHTAGLDAFINTLKEVGLVEKLLKTSMGDFLVYLVANLNLLSRYSEDSLHKWKRLDATNALLNALNFEPRLKRSVFQAIINVAHDEDEPMIDSIGSSVVIFKEMLDQACVDLKMDMIDRDFKEFLDDYANVKRLKIHIIQVQYGKMALTAVLYAFYRVIMLNDHIKQNVYFDLTLKDYLKIILHKGNLVEKKFTLKLFAQLMFDNEAIRKDMASDKELTTSISDILANLNADPIYNGDDTFFMKIAKQCEIIQLYLANVDEEKAAVVSESQSVAKHIMISFHKTNSHICYQIKSKLELAGFKVWMDVDDSTVFNKINLVRDAIVNSFCVLVCVNEKYRQSISCRDEATYALNLNKTVFPLIMQSGYEKSKGWLSKLVENRAFVDFTLQDSLDESVKQLESHVVELVYGKTTCQVEHETLKSSASTKSKYKSMDRKIVARAKVIELWSETQVRAWFEKNALNTDFFNYLTPFDGEILRQLYEIRCDAPHFFNKSFKRIGNFNVSSLGSFSFQLQKLFTV